MSVSAECSDSNIIPVGNDRMAPVCPDGPLHRQHGNHLNPYAQKAGFPYAGRGPDLITWQLHQIQNQAFR